MRARWRVAVAAAAIGTLALGHVVQVDRVIHPIRSLAWDVAQAAALLALAFLALDLVWSVAPSALRAWRLTRRLVATYVVVAIIGFTFVGVAQYYALRVYLEYQMASVVQDQAAAGLKLWESGSEPRLGPPRVGTSATEVSDLDGVALSYASSRDWVQPPLQQYPGLLTSYLLVDGRAPSRVVVDDIPRPVLAVLDFFDLPPPRTSFATLD